MPRLPNHVPRIGQQAQTFLPRPPAPMPTAASQEQSIQEQMIDLSLEIYARLAVSYLDGMAGNPSPEPLRQLAAKAQVAAKAYFESMGVQIDG